MIAALSALFFVTALVYSMAGFGGGSTYLALLVLGGLPYEEIRPIALMCNLAVASYGAWHFSRSGYLSMRKTLPFVVSSIPMAFLGGTIDAGKTVFTCLLGVSLLVAAIRMLWLGRAIEPRRDLRNSTIWLTGVPIGAALGLLAGIVGIGGGIYLAPVLLFLGWSNSKETAGAASFFILVNSVAGLAGQFSTGGWSSSAFLIPLLIAVTAGGQLGSRLGAGTLSKLSLQRITGVLILAVSGRLLWSLL